MSQAAKEAGNKLYTEGRFAEALENYNRAVELESGNHVHYSNRSACYFSMDRFLEALQDAETCVRLKPDWPRGYLRKGKALHELKRYPDAISAFKTGLTYDPANEPLQSALKAAETKNKPPLSDLFSPEKVARLRNHPKTAPFFEQADFQQLVERVQLNPSSASGLLLDPRVMTCFQVNMELELQSIQTNAFAGLNDILKNSPMGDISGKVGVGKKEERDRKVQEEQRKREERERKVQEEENKKQAEEAKKAGNEAYRARNFPEALRLYDQAISLHPSEIIYHTNKATVYFEASDYDQCVRTCDQAIQIGLQTHTQDSKIAKAYVRKAHALKRLGRLKDALSSFLEARKLHSEVDLTSEINELQAAIPPENPGYSEDMTLIEQAEKRNTEGNEAFRKSLYSEAEGKYSEAIDLNPSIAKYWANRAAARIKEDNLAGALRDITRSISLDNSVVKVWNRKGLILHSMANYPEALLAYDTALTLNTEDTEGRNGFAMCIRSILESGQEGNPQAGNDPEVQEFLANKREIDSQSIRNKLKLLVNLQ